MSDKSKSAMGPSVESPSDSREGLTKNCAGMPETWDVKQIFEKNTPPDTMAKDSVTSMGSK